MRYCIYDGMLRISRFEAAQSKNLHHTEIGLMQKRKKEKQKKEKASKEGLGSPYEGSQVSVSYNAILNAILNGEKL